MGCMGLSDLVGGTKVVFKRKFRWMFTIPNITPDGTYAIPAIKGGRPSLTFKEHGVHHTNEDIYFPMKPEWKPITLTFYDIDRQLHPIVEWIAMVYTINSDCDHKWYPSVGGHDSNIPGPFKQTATLELFDGCGTTVEKWKIENCWPQAVEFGELDYGSSEVVTCTVTLRYDRACWVSGC